MLSSTDGFRAVPTMASLLASRILAYRTMRLTSTEDSKLTVVRDYELIFELNYVAEIVLAYEQQVVRLAFGFVRSGTFLAKAPRVVVVAVHTYSGLRITAGLGRRRAAWVLPARPQCREGLGGSAV